MKVFWREHKSGQRLILDTENGEEVEIGGFRRTPRGYDALAKTTGYDPGRAQKGFATAEEAKAFVESFQPWDIYIGNIEVEIDSTVHPLLEETHDHGD
jgi:hypothetical protein